MGNLLKAIGAFLAFFCLILGLEIIFSSNRDPSLLIGAFFAASGATFFFVFFFKK